MKFDENGNKIVTKTGATLKSKFLAHIHEDIKIIAEYLKTDIPEIKLKTGFGGDYTKGLNLVRIGFGEGVYNKESRTTLVHEMLHHKGYEHGSVMGLSFMSHSNNDHISPKIVSRLFKTVI